MLRRAAVVAAGLAMATSFGLAGAGMASAAAPALEITNGATWTLFPPTSSCEYDVFNTSTFHFTSDVGGDRGTWSGGGSTIKMVWKHGANKGATFIGTLVGKSPKYYQGKFGGTGGNHTVLIKGTTMPPC